MMTTALSTSIPIATMNAPSEMRCSVVPHLARMLFASADHRILMPGSMLAGAALLLVCDLVAKSLALPINTITALMGIPVVIFVVVRNRNIF